MRAASRSTRSRRPTWSCAKTVWRARCSGSRPATDPLQVVVLVDNTAASRDMMADVRRALPTFLSALGDTSEITLMTFGDRPT